MVINKVDKPDQRAYEVQDEVFDLFGALGADEKQLDFPTLFASAKQGWASETPDATGTDMNVLFERILTHLPPPTIEENAPFRLLATTLEADPYLGRLLTGRILSGSIKHAANLKALSRDGTEIERARVSKLLAYRGLERTPLEEAHAGDIVAIAGFSEATVADTLCAPEVTQAIASSPIDPSTIAVTFSVNDSPLAGREGDKVTTRMIRDRLFRESEGNVAVRVRETDDKDACEVAGSGELQLAVLIEQMRREGFEMSISRPRVLMKSDPETGQRLEPIDEVVVDVDDEFTGAVIEAITQRKGELLEMKPAGAGKTRLVFHAPARGLIGYHGDFLTATRGTGIMNRMFHTYAPYRGTIPGRRAGVLVSTEQGEAQTYALVNLEDRGPLMVGPGDKVYSGMILGEHNKGNDLDVNPLKAKQLTNFRAAGKDENVVLTPPIRMTLERAIPYIGDDELVEVTPKSVRLRKRYLDPHERKRMSKRSAAESA